MNAPIKIPNKSLFKMNEVCGLTGVKPYVLRFWESEFIEIDPITNSSGQKLYEHKDIEAIALIKKLLFDDKMTIEKAKAEIGRVLHATEDAEAELELEGELPPPAPKATVRAGFDDKDIEKLVMAKTRLQDVLRDAERLRDNHDWN